MPLRSLAPALLCAVSLLHGTASAQSSPAPAPAASEAPEFVYETNEPKRALKEGKVIP